MLPCPPDSRRPQRAPRVDQAGRPGTRRLEAFVHWLLVIAIVVAVYVFVPITG